MPIYSLLVVDDEVEIREGLRTRVDWKTLGFDVVDTASDGASALDIARRIKPDVVLCDIRMPRMDGIEFARQIASLNDAPVVVFLSGYRDFEYARQALRHGVRDYLLKPTRIHQLTETFVEIRRRLNERNRPTRSEGAGLPVGAGYYQRIMHHVRDYVERDLASASLTGAADVVRLTPSYLSSIMKTHAGQTFTDLVNRSRMERAAELLGDVSFRTYEISQMVGYQDPKNFSRAFRRYFGVSPRSFRLGERRQTDE